jgi:hypothetical protein
MVKSVCERHLDGVSPIQRWNNKLRLLRKHLGGWARHLARLSTLIDEIEDIFEVWLLYTQEIEFKSHYNAHMASMLREEDLKWYQRSKVQFVLEGDSNTRYFYSISNGRHRKKLIHSLVQDEGMIVGHEQLKSYITSYYKNLF